MHVMRPRGRWIVASLITAVLAVVVLRSAPAWRTTAHASVTGPLGLACTDFTSGPVPYTKCSGTVASFDGVPIDSDVTVPLHQVHARLPLIELLHGGGDNKNQFQAATPDGTGVPPIDQFNNVWFASRGYAVLATTSRGFQGSCGPSTYATNPPVTGPCAAGWTHLSDRRYEIHDFKHLAGLLADAGVADPRRVGMIGFSIGGLRALMAAAEGDVITRTDGTIVPWRSRRGLPMHLAAVVPYAAFTDFSEIFLPNGRAGDGVLHPDGDHLQPYGVLRQSFTAFITALVRGAARFPAPGQDHTGAGGFFDVEPQVEAGEPYSDATPGLAAWVAHHTRWTSPLYQTDLLAEDVARHDETPTFFIQGSTDEVNTPVQAISFLNRQLAADPTWPVGLYLADVGHTSQNQPAAWASIHAVANEFLDHYLQHGRADPTGTYRAALTTCDGSPSVGVRPASLSDLAPGRLTLSSPLGSTQSTSSVPRGQPTGVVSDRLTRADATRGRTEGSGPVPEPDISKGTINQSIGCIQVPVSMLASDGAATWEWPVSEEATLIGGPLAKLQGTVGAFGAPSVDAAVALRLWDVDPTGTATLITRGVYRYQGAPGPIDLSTQLYGGAWTLRTGHRLRLEVTQDDFPYVRPDNLPSTVAWSAVQLTLPTAP